MGLAPRGPSRNRWGPNLTVFWAPLAWAGPEPRTRPGLGLEVGLKVRARARARVRVRVRVRAIELGIGGAQFHGGPRIL